MKKIAISNAILRYDRRGIDFRKLFVYLVGVYRVPKGCTDSFLTLKSFCTAEGSR